MGRYARGDVIAVYPKKLEREPFLLLVDRVTDEGYLGVQLGSDVITGCTYDEAGELNAKRFRRRYHQAKVAQAERSLKYHLEALSDE